MRAFVILLVFSFAISFKCSGQKMDSIYVYVHHDNSPLPGTTIRVNDNSYETNLFGTARVPRIKSDTLIISHIGFNEERIAISTVQEAELKLQLIASSIILENLYVTDHLSPIDLLSRAYSKVVDHRSWLVYFVQTMGEGGRYVKATEASSNIYIKHMIRNKREKEIKIGLQLIDVIERVENVHTKMVYDFDFQSLLLRSLASDFFITYFNLKEQPDLLTIKSDENYWYIETLQPIRQRKSVGSAKWVINKRDTTLLYTARTSENKKDHNFYRYHFETEHNKSYLSKAAHKQVLQRKKGVYSGSLELFLKPSHATFESIPVFKGKEKDLSELKPADSSAERLGRFRDMVGGTRALVNY